MKLARIFAYACIVISLFLQFMLLQSRVSDLEKRASTQDDRDIQLLEFIDKHAEYIQNIYEHDTRQYEMLHDLLKKS